MTLHTLTTQPDPRLAAALDAFERQFHYPLGPNATFSVSHSPSYLTFFRAIGEPVLFIAEDDRGVVGTVAAALRPLRFPDGATHTVGYLCDLKFRPDARREPLVAVFTSVEKHLRSLGLQHAYGVVMDGTRRTPLDYTGRLGIAPFVPVGKVTILLFDAKPPGPADVSPASSTSPAPPLASLHPSAPAVADSAVLKLDAPAFAELRARLLPPGYVTLGGDPPVRSAATPVHFATADGQACALLEDTRLGKRLLLDHGGGELQAAHLSAFAFTNPQSAAALLRAASAHCARAGFHTLLASLPHRHAEALQSALPDLSPRSARATIYGCQMAATTDDWWITSAEI